MSDNKKTNQEFFDAMMKSSMQKNSMSTKVSAIPGLTVGQIYSATGAANMMPNGNFTAVGSAVNSSFSSGLDLKEGADIKFGNVSLKDFMEKVSMRLNMMVPNPQLEKQWEELRLLGEAYRAVEKECIDKAKVWDILKRD